MNKQSFFLQLQEKTRVETALISQALEKHTFNKNQYIATSGINQAWNLSFLVDSTSYSSVFWNPKEVRDFIATTPTDFPDEFKKLTDVSAGYLKITAPDTFDLRILELNDTLLQNKKQISVLDTLNFSSSVPLNDAYLKDNDTFDTSTWSYRYFDFANKNYLFLVKNTWEAPVSFFNLQIIDSSWSGVYMNPISNASGFIQWVSYSVLYENGKYLYKILNL